MASALQLRAVMRQADNRLPLGLLSAFSVGVAVFGCLSVSGICEGSPLDPSSAPSEPYAPEPSSPPVFKETRLDTSVAPRSSAPATRWYGYQLMLNDALAIAAICTRNSAAATVGVVTLLLGPSVLHGVHRRPLQAVLSPILRVALPLFGGLIGAKLESCRPNEWFCGLRGALVGGGLGLLTALIIDWSVLSLSPVAPEEARPESQRPARLGQVSAGVAPIPSGGASVVLGGRF